MWNDVSVTPERQGQYPCAVKVDEIVHLEYRMYFMEGKWMFEICDEHPYMTPSAIGMEVLAWYSIPEYKEK